MTRDRSARRFDPTRRHFLRTAAGGAASAAVAVSGPMLLTACGDDRADAGDVAEPKEAEARAVRTRVPFHGAHQNGVLLRAPEAGIVAAFNAHAANRAELQEAFRALSSEAQHLMDGVPPEQ